MRVIRVRTRLSVKYRRRYNLYKVDADQPDWTHPFLVLTGAEKHATIRMEFSVV